MTKEEMAKRLHGRIYHNEITDEEQQIAKEYGLVIIYGTSDDLAEIRGAIEDEIGAWGERMLLFTQDGFLSNDCEDEDCPYFEQLAERAGLVRPLWRETPDYLWTYETAIPHATFDIIKYGEKYCRGIVFALKDIPRK